MLRELASYERALYYSDRHTPFHLVSVLQIGGAPAPDTLRQACDLLFKRHPLLGTHIVEVRGHVYFEAAPNPRVQMSILDRRGDQDWIAVAESEFTQRIDSTNGPLLRWTYLFQAEGARAEIILSCSHSIVDAVGLGLIWHELLEDCQELEEGHVPEVAATALEPAADDLFPPAFRGASLTRRMLGYMLDQMRDEASYRFKTRGQTILPMRAPSAGHILTMRFSSQLTDALGRCARASGVTLNSLLNAAMMLAVNRHLYGGQPMPMRTITFATLRPYLAPPVAEPTLAPYISMLRYTVMVDPARGLWNVARGLHAQIQASFKRGDKFTAASASDDMMKLLTRYRPFRMTNTGLNYSGAVGVKQTYGPISVLGLHGAVTPFDLGPEYAAQVCLIDGELSWDITYMEADMDRALAQTMADWIRSTLEEAASQPRESVAADPV